MTFEELQKANSTIITTDIKGKDYAQVNQRIKAFRMLYPNGCIETTLLTDDGERCVINARVYDDNKNLLGTGTAHEKTDFNRINTTSHIENCETSAVGRALAMCGIGIDMSIASKEEMEKVKTFTLEQINDAANKKVEFLQYISEKQLSKEKQDAICKHYKVNSLHELTPDNIAEYMNMAQVIGGNKTNE